MDKQAREGPQEPDRPTAGQLVRLRRREAGMTQDGLAQAMTAIGEPTMRKQVSEWEVGQVKPSARKLLAVLEVTGGIETGRESALARRVHELERELVKLRRHLTADIA